MSKVAKDKGEIVAELPRACADETAAVEFMERQRWGDSPCCPRCGDMNVYQMRDRKTEAREKATGPRRSRRRSPSHPPRLSLRDAGKRLHRSPGRPVITQMLCFPRSSGVGGLWPIGSFEICSTLLRTRQVIGSLRPV
jgi:hypothetical protein